MNYELAKELKDAGFSQADKGTFLFAEGTNLGMTQKEMTKRSAYAPTLSELIAACGKRFEYLRRTGDTWSAYCDEDDARTGAMYLPSPEEAVAHLWLRRNSKS